MSSRESSIAVAVRVRPFTAAEQTRLIKQQDNGIFLGDGALGFINDDNKENRYSMKRFGPQGLRKIVDVVDDRMLIFDPPEGNPLANLSKNVFQQAGKRTSRFREHRFVFDKLFDTDATQEDIYHSTTRPLLDSVLDGFNATVFAYGATGCGKTYTISGTVEEPGIIFLTMKELFEKINQLKDTKHIEVSLSYLEIYNETIRDLMQPDNGGKLLTLREDANSRISVSNLSTHSPHSVEDVMDMIIIGNQNRTSSPTEANSTSSRSHAVLQINVTQKNRTADIRENHTFATLSIIDLAGSERAAATKNRGPRLHEGANINKSLLALGNCINALCDVKRKNHVPYRNSKLTRLLKFSLGGNCKTVMIVCISPSSHHYDETLNTLKYADRAKEIKTKITRNQHNLDRHVGSYLKMITEQRQEIDELRKREETRIKEAVESAKIQRDRVAIGVLEFIDNLKCSLNTRKFEQLKLRKSLILCKRRLLIHQKVELKRYLRTFETLPYKPEEFLGVFNTLNDLQNRLKLKIDELESLYNQETELDLVLSGSANSGINRLTELEGWSEYDKILLDSSLSLIKDSVDKTILHNSFVAFDKLINSQDFNGNFKFASMNLLNLVAKIDYMYVNIEDGDSLKDEFQAILEDFYQDFQESLNDLMDIDSKFAKFSNVMQYNITSEISIPTSPIRKLARLSPFKGSPVSGKIKATVLTAGAKVAKITSPTSKENKPVKKVRWDVATVYPQSPQSPCPQSPNTQSQNDGNNEGANNGDDERDPNRNNRNEDTDTDINMDDLSKENRSSEMQNADQSAEESMIERSFSELEQAISAQKKRRSLTSKTLKPVLKKTSYNSNNMGHNINFNENLQITDEPLISHTHNLLGLGAGALGGAQGFTGGGLSTGGLSIGGLAAGGLGAPIRLNDDSLMDATMND